MEYKNSLIVGIASSLLISCSSISFYPKQETTITNKYIVGEYIIAKNLGNGEYSIERTLCGPPIHPQTIGNLHEINAQSGDTLIFERIIKSKSGKVLEDRFESRLKKNPANVS